MRISLVFLIAVFCPVYLNGQFLKGIVARDRTQAQAEMKVTMAEQMRAAMATVQGMLPTQWSALVMEDKEPLARRLCAGLLCLKTPLSEQELKAVFELVDEPLKPGFEDVQVRWQQQYPLAWAVVSDPALFVKYLDSQSDLSAFSFRLCLYYQAETKVDPLAAVEKLTLTKSQRRKCNYMKAVIAQDAASLVPMRDKVNKSGQRLTAEQLQTRLEIFQTSDMRLLTAMSKIRDLGKTEWMRLANDPSSLPVTRAASAMWLLEHEMTPELLDVIFNALYVKVDGGIHHERRDAFSFMPVANAVLQRPALMPELVRRGLSEGSWTWGLVLRYDSNHMIQEGYWEQLLKTDLSPEQEKQIMKWRDQLAKRYE